jgi:hypothetical protein
MRRILATATLAVTTTALADTSALPPTTRLSERCYAAVDEARRSLLKDYPWWSVEMERDNVQFAFGRFDAPEGTLECRFSILSWQGEPRREQRWTMTVDDLRRLWTRRTGGWVAEVSLLELPESCPSEWLRRLVDVCLGEPDAPHRHVEQ